MTRWACLAALTLAGCAAAAPAGDDVASGDEAISSSAPMPLVIGIRSTGTRVAKVFDDQLIVRVAGKADVTYAASTHPWYTSAAAATDADGDGVPDVGMLAPGRYHAKVKGTSYGAPTYAVSQANGNAAVPGYRNTNHDDTYSPEEIAASVKRGDLLTDILVHAAGPAPGSLAPIGCQVLGPDDMKSFSKLVGKEFDYVLIDEGDDLPTE